MIDDDTLDRARGGDPAACRKIVEEFAPAVVAIVGSGEVAEAVLGAVVEDLPRYALGVERLGAWIETRARTRAGAVAAAAGESSTSTSTSTSTSAIDVDRLLAARRSVPEVAPVRPRAKLGIAAAIVGLACIAAVVAAFVRTPEVGGPRSGSVAALERTATPIARGVAVLEPGATIEWTGASVQQRAGNVFYRIEPGGAVTVTTPHGVITTATACLRVVVGTGTVVTIDEGAAIVAGEPRGPGARVELR